LFQLERLALEGRSAEALEQLRTILPEFQRYAPKPLEAAVEESTALSRLRADRRPATADSRTNDQIVGPIRVPVVGVPL